MVSIVIPVLNEARTITSLLAHLAKNAHLAIKTEILVVDGGSQDSTRAVVSAFKGSPGIKISLITSTKGRAAQMNTGAAKATGSILYFLHADSFPPKNFNQLIVNEVDKGNAAGCFKMKFDSGHWWLRLAGWFTKFSWRACRGGDQSQYITRKLFDEIGGYDTDYIIYEDNILINQLYARKQFTVIQHCIKSSARLYREKGVWALQYHFWAIYVKRWL
ncbi:MAG: TIGR04283 family arsenosugar biosynthesis glycosyltransferase, partial [Marinirhabdus sp.]